MTRTKRQSLLTILLVFTSVSVCLAQATPPQPTLWSFLGISGGCRKIHDKLFNRHGNLPALEKKPPLLAIADPANLESAVPAIKKAAEVKQAEDLKKQKIKAIKYLTKIGCGCYDTDGSITEALVAGSDDCTEAVRLATVEAIANAAEGECCANCGQVCCCNEEMIKRLAKMAYERDDKGCYLEPSKRVREAAAKTLEICCPDVSPIVKVDEQIESPQPEPEREGVIDDEEADREGVEDDDEADIPVPETSGEADDDLAQYPYPFQTSQVETELQSNSPVDRRRFVDQTRSKEQRQLWGMSEPAEDEMPKPSLHVAVAVPQLIVKIPEVLESKPKTTEVDKSQDSISTNADLFHDQTTDIQRRKIWGTPEYNHNGVSNTADITLAENKWHGTVIHVDAQRQIAHIHFEDREQSVAVGQELMVYRSKLGGFQFVTSMEVYQAFPGSANVRAVDQHSFSQVVRGLQVIAMPGSGEPVAKDRPFPAVTGKYISQRKAVATRQLFKEQK